MSHCVDCCQKKMVTNWVLGLNWRLTEQWKVTVWVPGPLSGGKGHISLGSTGVVVVVNKVPASPSSS